MIFDDKNKCLQLAEKILMHYQKNLGTDCKLQLLQLSENITYLVEHTGNIVEMQNTETCGKKQKAVLRLSRPEYHTEEELQAEITWMMKLQEDFKAQEEQTVCTSSLQSGFCFCIRQPLAGDDGQYLYAVEDTCGQVYFGTVFTYLSGTPLEDISLQEQVLWYERLGEVTAMLHRQVRMWQSSSGLPRFHWNYETMIGQKAIWGDWRKVFTGEKAVRSGQGVPEVLNRADRMIRRKLETYGRTPERYGLIHGDLRGANLLVEGDSLKIIDFDDCGFGWYMQDLAASLSFIETEETVPELVRAWVTGYRKQGILKQEDLDMIPAFIMMRRLQLLAWVHSRTNAASAIAYRDQFEEGTVELAKRYTGEFTCRLIRGKLSSELF